jgi:ABC-type iron transport system FetAB permease component
MLFIHIKTFQLFLFFFILISNGMQLLIINVLMYYRFINSRPNS